ncbi:MAG: hypothetical protein WCW35_10850 [Bacteroidota bacterium]
MSLLETLPKENALKVRWFRCTVIRTAALTRFRPPCRGRIASQSQHLGVTRHF